MNKNLLDSIKEAVREGLYEVEDPELNINIIDLGLVRNIEMLDENSVHILMTLTSPVCPLSDVIEERVSEALSGIVTHVKLEFEWLPIWTPDDITPDGKTMLNILGFRF